MQAPVARRLRDAHHNRMPEGPPTVITQPMKGVRACPVHDYVSELENWSGFTICALQFAGVLPCPLLNASGRHGCNPWAGCCWGGARDSLQLRGGGPSSRCELEGGGVWKTGSKGRTFFPLALVQDRFLEKWG